MPTQRERRDAKRAAQRALAATMAAAAPSIAHSLSGELEATSRAPGSQDAPQGTLDATARTSDRQTRLAHRLRKENAICADASLAASRAHAVSEVCAEVSGERGPPVPLSLACAAHGIPLSWVLAGMERGELPHLDIARAKGRIHAARMACGDGPDARQWAWLAERLAPKELHLPTKITGVSQEDGGAPLALAAAPARAPGRAELLAIAAEAASAAAALPEDTDAPQVIDAGPRVRTG